MKYHVGFTIGPIFDTILSATTPAALWFASSVFSDLSRRLCAGITAGLPGAFLYSPCYDPAAPVDDGLGKYHDRILFTVEAERRETLEHSLKEIADTAIRETAGVFPQDSFDGGKLEAFLTRYLQIHWLLLPEEKVAGENPILCISPMLDALELIRTFPSDDGEDPFRKMFISARAADQGGKRSNALIQESPLFRGIAAEKCMLTDRSGNIRDINAIAARVFEANYGQEIRTQLRRDRYFAVVSADGDGLTDFFKGLPSAEKVRIFSEACLLFSTKAAKAIVAFGGMPIYAGGDDLLFLSPITGMDGREITSLCTDLRELFVETLQTALKAHGLPTENVPTLSFGAAVQYCKSPLYEAHQRSVRLLEQAKDSTGKDRVLLDLQKHSGQSLSFSFPNGSAAAFQDLMSAVQGNGVPSGQLHSVGHTLAAFAQLFSILIRDYRGKVKEAEDEDRFVKRWMNLFDNPDQQAGKAYLEKLGRSFYLHMVAADCGLSVPEPVMEMTHFSVLQRQEAEKKRKDKEQRNPVEPALQALVNLLAWERFLCAKEDERE